MLVFTNNSKLRILFHYFNPPCCAVLWTIIISKIILNLTNLWGWRPPSWWRVSRRERGRWGSAPQSAPSWAPSGRWLGRATWTNHFLHFSRIHFADKVLDHSYFYQMDRNLDPLTLCRPEYFYITTQLLPRPSPQSR